MNKILNYLEDDNWYKIFDAENEEDIEYKLLEKEEVKTLLKEIERLNNIITELERDLESLFDKMEQKQVQINGKGYYYTDLIPIEDLLNKVKTLKGSDKE